MTALPLSSAFMYGPMRRLCFLARSNKVVSLGSGREYVSRGQPGEARPGAKGTLRAGQVSAFVCV
jgi:hypothetical protein